MSELSKASMTRFRQVAAIWNWLPAFRAVAEHESIHGAATALCISPSALSRTVKLLEEALSTELFFRHENGIKLTAIGGELLKVTRDAMRLVDDCMADRENVLARHAGPFLVGVTSSLGAAIATHALLEQQPSEPNVVFDVRMIAEEEVEGELLRGNLDLVVCFAMGESSELVAERLADVDHGVYAATGHALAARAGALALDDLAKAAFVSCRSSDGWPRGRPRKIAVAADSVDTALALCERTDLLCVLPNVLVNRSTRGLTRLCDAGPPSPMFAVHRKRLPDQRPGLLERFIDGLRRGLATP